MSKTIPTALRRGPADQPITTWLYRDQAERLKALSVTVDLAVSTLVRHAIQRFLDEHPEAGR